MRKILILASSVILFFNSGCHSEHNETEEKTRFTAMYPLLSDTSITEEYVCQIHAYQHIELRALEKGYLQDIYVDEGQKVKAGDLMFQIMPLLYKAEYQKAKAEADYVEIEYQNTKSLADSNIVAPNELALAKAKFEKAKAELDLAQVHLGFTEIRAPFDGLMDHFKARKGSLLDEGEFLTTLSDNSKMWVYFNVPEAEYLNLKSKINPDSLMHVRLMMANQKLFNQDGIVETIEADFNNETGNIAFRATFENPEGLLRHGETGNILMRIPIKDALIIPQKATYEVLDKKYVYVINDENIIQPRQIVIAAEMLHIYAVSSGLSANERILIDGLRKVKNGDEIEYDLKDAKEVLTHLELFAE